MINDVGYINMTDSLNNIFSAKTTQRKITLVIQHDATDANSLKVQALNFFMEYPESDFLWSRRKFMEMCLRGIPSHIQNA
jgi:hypothetical protein